VPARLSSQSTADVVGRHLQTVIRVVDIVDAYNQSRQTAQPVYRTIEAELQHRLRARRYTSVAVTHSEPPQ